MLFLPGRKHAYFWQEKANPKWGRLFQDRVGWIARPLV